MLLDIDTNLSPQEIAKKLGLNENDIKVNGEDFCAYVLEPSDFDERCENQDIIENVPDWKKVDVLQETLNFYDEIHDAINRCIYESISEEENSLLEEYGKTENEELADEIESEEEETVKKSFHR